MAASGRPSLASCLEAGPIGMMLRVARPLARVALLALLALPPGVAHACPGPRSPEQLLRQLTTALLRADRAAVEALAVGDPAGIAALSGAEPALERAARLEGDPDELAIERLRPYELGGRAVGTELGTGLPVGTTALFAATLRGGQTQIWRVVHTAQGWKADLRWSAHGRAMAEQGEALEPVDSPAWVARQLTLALLELNRARAEQLLQPGADLNLVFLEAPEQPDPFGHLQMLALEMPLVRLATGEAVPMADGGVAQGGEDPERQLLLGLFGIRELPFLLQRSAGRWHVLPQPWFLLLR